MESRLSSKLRKSPSSLSLQSPVVSKYVQLLQQLKSDLLSIRSTSLCICASLSGRPLPPRHHHIQVQFTGGKKKENEQCIEQTANLETKIMFFFFQNSKLIGSTLLQHDVECKVSDIPVRLEIFPDTQVEMQGTLLFVPLFIVGGKEGIKYLGQEHYYHRLVSSHGYQ